jgi:phosphoribosylglycinamide formyltransferase-1
MPKVRKSEDPRLTKVSKICLALPDAERALSGGHAATGGHATFTVRKKTFCYFLNNHHGDGRVCVTCKVLPGDNQRLADAEPDKFYLPAYIASRGWVALRLDRGKIDWDEVADFLRGGYVLAAPKTLAARVLAEAEE